MVSVSEKAFEELIERALLAGGPDVPPGVDLATQEVQAAYGPGRVRYVSGGNLLDALFERYLKRQEANGEALSEIG